MKYKKKKLKNILKEHKKWLEGRGGKRANFAMAELYGINFKEANLRGAAFFRANLSAADLSGANLQEANLRGANLKAANLKRANLQGANFRESKLWWTNFERADLTRAKFEWADTRGANFSGARIENTTGIIPDLYILRMQQPNIKLRAWKYLYNGKSPCQGAKYEVGKTYTEQNYSRDERNQCDRGLNVSTLEWCLRHSSGYKSEFMEVEFQAKDIIAIPFATDGKFRVKKFRVLRKISRREAEKIINNFLKPADL